MRINGHIPVVKESKPANFLFHRSEQRLNYMGGLVPVSQDLYREAIRLGLSITGPIHWHYVGFESAAKPFTLEISLPVAQIPENYDGRFHFKRTAPFPSVSLLHEGDWSQLAVSYKKLTEFVQKKRLQLSGITRELYINVDFASPEANITEIQMGIASWA